MAIDERKRYCAFQCGIRVCIGILQPEQCRRILFRLCEIREPGFVYADSTKQLFIDDYAVSSITNVTRTLNKAAKTSPVLVPDKAWESSQYGSAAYIYGSVIYDEQENVYKIWYQGTGQYICYATSADGRNMV